MAELTHLLDLAATGWPAGVRVIVRKERPHLGAQLRITDIDGHRITAFATNTPAGGPGTQLPELELRHRRHARVEDRCAKDSGLANLPLHEFTQNQIYCAIVALACEITSWMQLLALTSHQARRWEPKRLRLRLILHRRTSGHHRPTPHPAPVRPRTLDLSAHAPWTHLALHALTTLRALTGCPAPSG